MRDPSPRSGAPPLVSEHRGGVRGWLSACPHLYVAVWVPSRLAVETSADWIGRVVERDQTEAHTRLSSFGHLLSTPRETPYTFFASFACDLRTCSNRETKNTHEDEPTSGLDAASASEVMALLRRLASETGMIIVTSVHQPSTRVFNSFDQVSHHQKLTSYVFWLMYFPRCCFFAPV